MSLELDLIKPNHVEDARTTPCPGPLLAAKNAISKVEIGEIVELQASDAGAIEDIPAFAKKSGNEYLGLLLRDRYDSHFILRKR